MAQPPPPISAPISRDSESEDRLFRVFLHAQRFADSSQLICRAIAGGNREFSNAASVALAFAIEVNMKCMLYMHDLDVPKTHSLVDLYGRLPNNDKRMISQRLDQTVERDSFLHHTVARLNEIETATAPPDLSHLTILEYCDHTFEYARYIFDESLRSNHKGVIGLDNLWEATYRRLWAYHPDWPRRYAAIGKSPVVR